MITVAPFVVFLLNVNLDLLNKSCSLLSLGIYYGLLTTFPIGPSQLLFVKTCLLEKKKRDIKLPNTIITNKVIVAAISGLILSQLLVFLSIYLPPLQSVWIKPQMWACFILPYIVVCSFRVRKFLFNGLLKTNNSIYTLQVWTTFENSFFFQFLNPILFSKTIFTRLISVVLFCYSNNLWFVAGGILGWLSGQVLFVCLNWCLLFRLKYDAPTVYVFLERRIYQVWYFAVFVTFWICLTKIPITNNLIESDSTKLFPLWPHLIFEEDISNRPVRALFFFKQRKKVLKQIEDISNITRTEDTLNILEKPSNQTEKRLNITDNVLKSTEDTLKNTENKPKINDNKEPYNKKRFSEYLFEKCLTNGNYKLSHIFPQNLITFKIHVKNMFKILDLSEQPELNVGQNWVYSQTIRKIQLKNILENRINALDKGISIDIVLDQKTGSKDYAKNPINNRFDFRLNSKKRAYQEQQHKHENQETLDIIKPEVNNVFDPLIPKEVVEISTTFDLKSKSFLLRGCSGVESRARNILNPRKIRKKILMLKMKTEMLRLNTRAPAHMLPASFVLPRLYTEYEKILLQSRRKELITTFDFATAQVPRGLLLSVQPFIRKAIKYPVLIFLKNSARWLLFQASEWEDDWADLAQEHYLYCFYDGIENRWDQFRKPSNWLVLGYQTKVISPFSLRPWHSSVLKPKSSCYLTAWGIEMSDCFGGRTIQQPAFWKPISKILKSKLSHQSSKQFARMVKLVISSSTHHVLVLTNRLNSLVSYINKVENRFVKETSKTRLLSHQSLNSKNEKMLESNQIASTNKHKSSVSDLLSSVDSHNLFNLQTNLASKRKHIQHKSVEIRHVSELLKKQNSIKPNKIIQTALFKSSFLVRNVKKQTKLQIHTISKQSFRSIKYNHLVLKSQLLEMKKQYVQISIQFKKLDTEGFKRLRKTLQHIKTNFIYISKEQSILIIRNLTNIVESWFDFSNAWVDNISILNDGESAIKQDNKMNTHILPDVLSQASVLHKIWQTNTRTKIYLSSLINDGIQSNSLKQNEHMLLQTQSLLITQTPEILTQNTWNELIADLPQYTPSSKLWIDLVPTKWSSKVQQHWNIKSISEYKKTENGKLPEYLKYHQQLVKKAQKLCTQWKSNLVAKNFTSLIQHVVLYKPAINEIFNNQRLTGDVLNKSNLFHISSDQDNILNDTEQMSWATPQTQIETYLSEEVEAEKSEVEQIDDIEEKYKETKSYDKPLIINDKIITYNLVSAFLRFADRDHDNFVKSISHLLLSKSLEKENVFPIISLLIDNILLSNKSREFRVLESLNVDTSIHNKENVISLNSILQQNANLFEQKETNFKNVFVDSVNTNYLNVGLSNQTLNSINQIQRFLWPIHRLEDLACMNRFMFGNQSRFSTLRIKMYPFIFS